MTGPGRSRRRSGSEQPFWSERSWLLSAAFLAGAMLLTVVVWVDRDTDEGPAGPGGPPVAVGLPTADAQVCPPGQTVTSGPATPPGDVTWQVVDSGKRIPVSASQGPTRTGGPLLRCFARTPMGAVLAAHVIPTGLGGPDWAAVADRQVVPGRGREVLLARLAVAAETTARGGGSYLGYDLVRYAPESAQVRLLVQSGSGGYASTLVELRWDGGDWKVLPSRTGAVHTGSAAVTGSAGFTLWRR
ncbi:hypothetical protein [Micromonospora echinospora]|uniref:hypothetical protein n=1 Tax=Micromonospora echinospora TaxID=1877 RepID=UPI003672EFD8